MQYLVNQKELKIIPGDLATVTRKSEPYSRQTGADISFARTKYDENQKLATELANTYFYVANVPLFMKQGRRLLAGIGGRQAFHIVYGEDTDAATRELRQSGFYKLSPAKTAAINAILGSEVTFVGFKDLKTRPDNDEYGHFAVRTGQPKRHKRDITLARMPFVRAGFGEGAVLEKVMAYLADNPIGKICETAVYLPTIGYVEQALANAKDGEMVARACRLNYFDNNSSFLAFVRYVGNDFALRGVPMSDAEGVAKKKLSPLEEIAGRATDTGKGVLVIRNEDLTPEQIAILTRKQ